MAVENMGNPHYISVEDAAEELGVSRSNLYYYMGQMEITTTTFPLTNRKAYIRRSDLERIKVARATRDNATRISSDDVLVFLAGLGLAVTPHADPNYGWGYRWQGGNWEGPYETPVAAIQAAFDRAVKDRDIVHQMPFLTDQPSLHWWDGTEWYTARSKDGQVEVFTGDSENDGYQRLEDVEAQEVPWLRPVPPTGNPEVDSELDRSRLAARLLNVAFQTWHMALEPIDWQRKGLKAPVIVHGKKLGTLLAVYNRLRKGNLLEWVNKKLAVNDDQPDEKE